MNKTHWTIKKLLLWSSAYLKDKGFETARLDSELLLSYVLDLSRLQLYTNYERPLRADELATFKDLLKRRLQREPIAYILQSKEFMGFDFKVNPAVLIPRPATEVLVEQVLEYARNFEVESLRILDVGAGSGCIGLSLSKMIPSSYVEAWELCPKALELAKDNAKSLGLSSDQYRAVLKDASLEKSWHTEDKFHIIVSNPPYIGHEEKASLSDEVVKYEPQMALFADERGLSFYRCIAEFAKMSIHDQGALFFEIGSTQRQDVEAILSKFQWSDISSVKDYEKHDRVMKGLFYVSKSSTSKSSCDRLENV